MLNQCAVTELVRLVLNERQSISRTSFLIEMDRVITRNFSLFSVNLVLEIDKEFLQVVNIVTLWHVADVD